MRIAIFSGPTLWNDPAYGAGGFTWLPPARRGDLLRAAETRPFAIGLIDGCFETVPSVWHKEILWALANGVHVFGAASMGALRAAELAPFGMRGVGRVFAAYADGTLERDDEVAVLHAPAELGFRPVTEALVDMRATIALAVAAGVLDARSGRRLTAIAADTFFRDRTWHAVLARAGDTRRFARFRRWLKTNRAEVKRADALEMLDELRALSQASREPFDANGFAFQDTSLWQQMVSDEAPPPHTHLTMAGLDPATQRARVCGRERLGISDAISRGDRPNWGCASRSAQASIRASSA